MVHDLMVACFLHSAIICHCNILIMKKIPCSNPVLMNAYAA